MHWFVLTLIHLSLNKVFVLLLVVFLDGSWIAYVTAIYWYGSVLLCLGLITETCISCFCAYCLGNNARNTVNYRHI